MSRSGESRNTTGRPKTPAGATARNRTEASRADAKRNDTSRAAADRAVADATRPPPSRSKPGPSGRRPDERAARPPRPDRPPAGTATAKVRRAGSGASPSRPPATKAAAPSPTFGDAIRTIVRAVVRYLTQPPSSREAKLLPGRMARRRSRRRLTATAIVLSLVFSVVVVKLVDLQVLNSSRYVAWAESQRQRTETLSADRGANLDRHGIPLALSVPTRSLFVDPKVVTDSKADVAADAAMLASVLGGEPAFAGKPIHEVTAFLQEAMTRQDSEGKPARFVYLARHLDPAMLTRIEELKKLALPPDPTELKGGAERKRFEGLAFVDESKRSQPAGDLAKSIIGQVDIDGKGLSGLEMNYADALTGTPGKVMLERSPQGKTIAAAEPEVVPALPGRDLSLTIDRSLQFETERILAEQVGEAGAKGGTAIVMKPDTGEVLSMANVVASGPNGEVVTDGNNAALTTVYEPGSVMKIVTASAALEENKVEPETPVALTDRYQVCNSTFQEAEDHGPVTWPVSDIMKHSSNVGTIKLGQMVGKDSLHQYLRSFGFGDKTAVGFPNEQPGALRSPQDWWCSDEGSIPIGQGVSVTPLQMLQAYNVIANGGVYVQPRLVAATVDADGTRRATPADPGRRVISPETAAQMNVMLRSVVDDGTGTAAAIPGYTPAGKTGTARIAQNGGYTDADGAFHYDATFVGFVPAQAPALSIFVKINDPSKQGIFGGVVAAPAFAKIGAAALREFDNPPPAPDLVAGGAPVDGNDPTAPVKPSTDPHAAPPSTILQRTEDGRVRVDPATGAPIGGSTTTTTSAPATTATSTRRSGTSTTSAPTRKAAGAAGGSTTTSTSARSGTGTPSGRR